MLMLNRRLHSVNSHCRDPSKMVGAGSLRYNAVHWECLSFHYQNFKWRKLLVIERSEKKEEEIKLVE